MSSSFLARSSSSSSRHHLTPRSLLRLYSTNPPADPSKPSIKLIAELRKHAPVSLPLAREALAASNLSIPAALQWLATRSSKKADKVAGRATNDGLVGVWTVSRGANARMRSAPVWAGMVEMACETDFVGRSEVFGKCLAEVAHSAAFHSEVLLQKQRVKDGDALVRELPVDQLLDAPLITPPIFGLTLRKTNTSVGDAIRHLMGTVGENITLRRASAVRKDTPTRKDLGLRLGTYGHGGTFNVFPQHFVSGRVASMAVLAVKAPLTEEEAKVFGGAKSPLDLGGKSVGDWFRKEDGFEAKLEELESAIARQVAGFPVTGIREGGEEGALYEQQFIMYPHSEGANVKDVLAKWAETHGLAKAEGGASGGLEVVEFLKWSVGGEAVVGK
ncbi:Elongation factor Ts, mitochondrial [Steccherinum ochraceum]|uniref:Elongation factor Ts, mitochondrial n=1 Tax=Steccherinum ochraceum TaxID=92696 RepID=A0A4R0RTD1_9APHY|nr:Elongation factor Ts, mitochondrial [Steccherinum ochraceum]